MKRVKHLIFWLVVIGIILLLFSSHVIAEDMFRQQRQALVDVIKYDVLRTRDFLNQEALDDRVLDALRKVPRHEFVPDDQRPYAYQNRPLPIGYGQTISQPYIVAVMTDLLKLKKNDRTLEIGTGSGYQAAILAELADSVYSIEIVEPLAKQAATNLKRAGYDAVHTRTGDGYYGWEEAAPFDGIVVTAVASHIPPPLIKQLKPGGRMIIPVGAPFMTQYLVLVSKDTDEKVTTRQILPVSFVPLTGKH
ncbi:MAG: protein-L-isoaspartate(D-aspartate) O-methyltransferase [Methylobacter tundripaludum]|uniref:Protein-L-isoaspartate O-methyltransferase n=1 Tax=Methylobacter tundripaludum TaxID=173365 RepID=A0A2S6GST4_9GAMM|nr:protein-L-isoaspartate(D-aspartate) O-methyltransferase [Methylobacter tundripaludum]MCF7966831.1 protein-L-isoaspartate(D-aspartate) O-methyltransferase [Methylobacter tundripaludum]MCK9638021.1 protein-L-isoaspartate(D-aspartate) O-methyltransferase [Methylobacter tundripaludum]PPK68270.1 protein-L-isoaspartate(D-aspartate) O-methyltransferase [Methylobacter tundripaludum]